MPVIRVDDEVFTALQKKATPLVDTPNSVLRRLLGLERKGRDGRGGKRVHALSGRVRDATERRDFRVPILRALIALGGRAPTREVLERVEHSMRNSLTPADREELPSGQRVRWQENAEWERYFMVKDGLLESGSPRGIWEITDEGQEYLQGHGGA